MKFVITDTLEKAGGPFIGPKGGKWADPDHKIPWKETGPARTKKVEVDGPKRTGKKDDEKTSRAAKEDDSKGEEAKSGAKYTKRVPYTDESGKKRYRYYYSESSAARDAKEGEKIKLGEQFATVNKVGEDGSVTVSIGADINGI